MSYTKNLEAARDRAIEQLNNVNRRQADVRRENKLLQDQVRRLRDEQPERIALEKEIAQLRSALARAEHKLEDLHEPEVRPSGLTLCKVCRAPTRLKEPVGPSTASDSHRPPLAAKEGTEV